MSERRVVFSIHGINTLGQWQEGIRDVLDQFYSYIPVSYSDYRPLSVAVWRLGGEALVALVTAGISAPLFFLARPRAALASCVVGGVYAVWVHVQNRQRLEGVIDSLYEHLRRPWGGRGSPPVVAHSLGTLLVCRALSRHNTLSLGTLILDGCVVARRYPWQRAGEQIVQVFNEIGGMDPVPWLAGTLRCTVRYMGVAGARGFAGPAVDKTERSPGEKGPVFCSAEPMCCDEHEKRQSRFKVHNVRYPEIDHSRYHKGVSHALDFWLPRLLGYDPQTYMRFQKDCVDLMILEAERGVGYRAKRSEMLDTCYGWYPGPLRRVIEEQVRTTPGVGVPEAQMEAFVNKVMMNLSRMVTATVEQLPRPSGEEPVIRLPTLKTAEWNYLDPCYGVKQIVAAALELWPADPN